MRYLKNKINDFFSELFYQMTVKISGQHYVKCLDYEESDFKKQIASALKRSV